MKKIILSAAITVSLISASCRKERTCECKTTETEVISGFGEQVNVNNSSSKVTVEKQLKRDFKYISNCFSTKSTSSDSGGNGNSAWTSITTTERICEIK